MSLDYAAAISHLLKLLQIPSPRTVKCPPSKFYLWTRANWVTVDVIHPQSMKEDLAKSHWMAGRPVKMFVNGWGNRADDEYGIIFRDAYLWAGNFNYVSVDYGCGDLDVRNYK